MNLRKIVKYLVIIVAIIAVIGIVIYFVTRISSQLSGQAGQTGSLPSATTGGAFGGGASGSLPGATGVGGSSSSSQGMSIASNVPTLDYFVDSKNNTIIVQPDGTIAEISNNNVSTLSSTGVQNIIGVDFSYDGTKILVNFGDARNPQTSVFDLAAKTWTPLPAGILSPRWSPSDYRIIFFNNNADGTESLTTYDASKTKNNIVVVATLNIKDVSINWPSKNIVLLSDKPSVYSNSSVWSFNLQNKTLTPLVTEKPGMESVWSTATNTIGLMFTGDASQYGGNLQLVDGLGDVIQRINFLTLPSKCLFAPFTPAASSTQQASSVSSTASTTASSTPAAPSSYLALYCGIPRDQDALSAQRLPDDYNEMAYFTSDYIYRINTSNGSIDVLLSDQSQNIDATNMKIFNNTLYFTNRYNDYLYSIPLSS